MTRKHIEARYVLRRVRDGRWKHGTPYSYSRLGRRCQDCLNAERIRKGRVRLVT